MADVVLDATVSGASANTYVTLAQADAYFDERLDSTDWTGATDNNKGKALVQAARRLDQIRWVSIKADADQKLQWPRSAAVDEDGNTVDSDEIPQCIKDAQCEMALFMLDSDLLSDSGLEAFEQVEIGPIKVTPRQGRRAGELPENVYREIRWYMRSRRGQVRMERA